MNNNKQLPFAHLNLRFNPFGELTREQRAATAVVDLGELPDLLYSNRVAVQFWGDHGRGKSTHLIALHNHFNDSPYTQIHIGDKPVFNDDAIQFIDSIELLSPLRRKRIYRSTRMLSITSHHDLSNELHSAGFDVFSKHIFVDNEHALKQIFDSRIEFARRDSGSLPALNLPAVRILITKFNDDIRAMEHHLYDIFQRLQEIDDVKV